MLTSEMNKAIAAFVVSALTLVELWFGWETPGITEQWILTLLAVINPLLVWGIPNARSYWHETPTQP